MNRSNIVLIGFMGAGKSSVGKLLADKLGWTFIDTDLRIEKQQQQKILSMFQEHGEAYFRQLESQAIEEVLNGQEQIIATGGGAVLAEHNRQLMLAGGYVVALKAEPEVIVRRVRSDQSRPLLQGDLEEKVHNIMEQRKHAYDFAHTVIDTSELTTEEIANLIIDQIRTSS